MAKNKIGIFDIDGINPNPLTNKPYSDRYKELAKVWSKFPAYEKANEIMSDLESNQLIFIKSTTGTGKTVMLPKFALAYTDYKGKVGISLPKRVVTLSAAKFAAETLDTDLGRDVGYQYKGSPKNMANNSNKLLYMTDGILTMKFVKDPLLSEFNVIIMDEAHERRVQVDMLMLFVKRILLSGKRPDLKVIIMSATIDGPKYQKYFTGIKSKIIEISGKPNYEITTHFLDKPTKSYLIEGMKLIDGLIDSGAKGDMLFFITTSNEALQLCRTIRNKYTDIYCIEVYADMDSNLKIYAESSDKYLELGNYDRKLIMATNVAESSITIDGLKYVIDSCYELFSRFDPSTYGQVIERKLISRAQALQRRGRVGRTGPGICYHLVTLEQWNGLEEYPVPDILRQDITMDILKIIKMSESKTLKEGLEILQELMDPPTGPFINAATKLYKLYNLIDNSNHLTKIGSDLLHFSSLPIERTLFMVYAFQLHCAREAAIITAMTEYLDGNITNLFFKNDTICEADCARPSAKNLISKLVQKKSDHFTYLHIFNEFKDSPNKLAWANKYGIKMKLLESVDKNVNQYYYKLISLSRAPQFDQERVSNVDVKKRLLEALKQSHLHLVAKNLKPTFTSHEISGQISKDSVVRANHKKQELAKKKFIYDELTNINGAWEFKVITLI